MKSEIPRFPKRPAMDWRTFLRWLRCGLFGHNTADWYSVDFHYQDCDRCYITVRLGPVTPLEW